MRAKQIVSRCILAGLFVYLVIQIVYLSRRTLPFTAEGAWRDVICFFLAQSVLLAASILVIFVFSFLQYRKKKCASPFDAMVLFLDGKKKSEIVLRGEHSLMVTGRKDGGEIFVEKAGEVGADRYLYGIYRLISGCWYFEAASGMRPVGVKRGDGGVVYRLKEGLPYPISREDVIYADTGKIVMR